MRLGQFRIWTNDFGSLLIDGGAMFGSVPKAIWGKLVTSDEQNRARLVTRSLIIKSDKRVFLVDTGCGPNLSPKYIENFAVRNTDSQSWSFRPEEVTDIIITHLHFDHCGWLFKPCLQGAEGLEPFFPDATVHLQRDNYETALRPSLKERASYQREQIEALSSCKLNILEGDDELLPGLTLHHSCGHTKGLQWVRLCSGPDVLVFPGDLIPSSHHLPLSYTTGYDIWVDRLMEEKEQILSGAVAGNWLVVFQHDPDICAARIVLNDKGHYAVAKTEQLL